jgi:UDP-glucose 4-epimerase
MSHVLITGASGFFGSILKRRLLAEGFTVANVDIIPDSEQSPNLTSVRGDVCDSKLMRSLFSATQFAAVIHCAAVLAHGSVDVASLWHTNVEGTRVVADCCREFNVKQLLFISTNCLWGRNVGHAIDEQEEPKPIEAYGRSKLAAEQLLTHYREDLNVIILRCPTIIDSGRLGLLSILFEFIDDGKAIWVVGDGSNRYQFIYAQDLATACLLALNYRKSDLFHVGSDNVRPLREVYETVIRDAKSRSRIRSLPKRPAIAAMRIAHALKVSPLGPYHAQMIAEDFVFDTSKIRERLGWAPTVTNGEMLTLAYRYYATKREEILARRDVSPHSRATPMGIIRLLKWVS